MRRYAVAALLAAGLALVLTGCATAQAPSAPAATSAAASTATTSAPSASGTTGTAQTPIAPEKNPPGDIPDNQAYVAWVSPGGFSVKVPEGWSRQAGASSAEFTDKLNTIQLAWQPATAAPTVASVTSQDVPKLQSSQAAFALTGVSAVNLPAGPAVLTKYQINGQPDAVTGKAYRLDVERYTVDRNGTRVDLTLLSPVGADNVDPWHAVSQSLKWK